MIIAFSLNQILAGKNSKTSKSWLIQQTRYDLWETIQKENEIQVKGFV